MTEKLRVHNTVFAFQNLTVSLPTTELNIQNFQHGAHFAFMCFVWISDQIANFSLNNINRLVLFNLVAGCLLRGTD